MPIKRDAGNGGQGEEDVVPAEGVVNASGEIGEVSRKSIAVKWDGSIVGAEIHEVDNQQYIQ